MFIFPVNDFEINCDFNYVHSEAAFQYLIFVDMTLLCFNQKCKKINTNFYEMFIYLFNFFNRIKFAFKIVY